MAKYEIIQKGDLYGGGPKVVGTVSHKNPTTALKLVGTKIDKLDNKWGSYNHSYRRIMDKDDDE